jgi:chorismate synthase
MQEFIIRECTTIDELDRCVWLQREVFGLPDIEISPRRHLIVSRQAGGWTLGAFRGEELVGFVHHLVAVRKEEISGYSHMMAVAKDFQNRGVGAQLKWAQRERALAEGRRFINWTWDPMHARNAHFNLNRLGAIAQTYSENFYGTDYFTDPAQRLEQAPGLQSDRIVATWQLASPRVTALAAGKPGRLTVEPVTSIAIPSDWASLVEGDIIEARCEQERVRSSFTKAFAAGLVCGGFERAGNYPRYLLYDRQQVVY